MKLVDNEFCISCAGWYNPFGTVMHKLKEEAMYICDGCLEYAKIHEWELPKSETLAHLEPYRRCIKTVKEVWCKNRAISHSNYCNLHQPPERW